MPTFKNDILAAAIDGFEAQKKRLDEQIAELRRMMTPHSGSSAPTASAPAGKRRTMSPAARRRIAEAQRKRWAAVKKDGAQAKSAGTAAKSAASKKRRLSPEGRRRIIEATKKRWAAVRAAAAAKAGK